MAVAAVLVGACELYEEPATGRDGAVDACLASADGQCVEPIAEVIDPVTQCERLVDRFCVAANRCGWDANGPGPCVEHFGARCERNQTAVPSQILTSALFHLSNFECAPDERWILWANPSGTAIFDAMVAWPE